MITRPFPSLILTLLLATHLGHAAAPLTLPLWPDGPPSALAPKSDATEKLRRRI